MRDRPALAALADLLRPLADLVAELPRPQRVAAEVVLLTRDSEETVDERVVGAATRSLLENALAAGRPVLVAVDDSPWLDRPSERALRFALRRVGPGLSTLVSCRTDTTSTLRIAPLGLDSGPARLTRLPLAPLGVGALHHLLRERVGATLSRSLLARIAREAAGNPLVAIEVTRAVQRAAPTARRPAPVRPRPEETTVRYLKLAATAAVVAVLTACGGNAEPAAAPPPPNEVTEPAPPIEETEATEPSAEAPAVDACALVTKADAEKLADTPLEDPVPVRETCTYSGPV
ncbi:hypothetical protein ACFFMR_03300 [Micromonospora andamanensis]|uniref:Uncharacterized protein n=1 Tax=Micromonospora andamanensis TaxID=1287068 RepID=A0ABQ4HVJ6_9ACTN|nr:hypothetical protein [Micromonospora andamanensis]GIJ09656.1 hypothetical protein Van01_28700 [Micromonospora andamanensis]